MRLNETLSFLHAWLRDLRSIGAVTPSGNALTRLMTADVSRIGGPIIELGPVPARFPARCWRVVCRRTGWQKRGLRSELALRSRCPSMNGI